MENGDFRPGFITSHTWNLIRVQSRKIFWYKGIWFSEITPIFFFLIWVAIHNRLATGNRILRWNPQAISTACWLCKSVTESRDHLFFECLYSEEVWCRTVRGLGGNRRTVKWSHLVQILENGLHEGTLTFLFRYCFQVVAYAIQHERNVKRVGEHFQPPPCLIVKLDKLIRNRITSLRRSRWKILEGHRDLVWEQMKF